MKEDQHIPYEALGRYLSGKIDRDEKESVERHLKDCPFCTQDLADAQSWLTQNPEPKKPWWKSLWLGAILCALTTDAQSQPRRTYDAQHPPRFEEFPVTEKWQPPAAPVQLKTNSERMFKTNLTNASKQPPEFAGHFNIARWGCGSVCGAVAFIDLKTGEVMPPPGKQPQQVGWDRWISCTSAFAGSGLEVRIDSRLIKFTCGLTELKAPKPLTPRVTYYVLENNQFRLLLDIPGREN